MSSKDVRRGITSRTGRIGGDAPDIGRVARVRGLEADTGERRSRRRGGRSNPARRRILLAWSAVLGLATVAAIGTAIFSWLLPLLGGEADNSKLTAQQEDARVRVVSKFPSPGRDEAVESVKRAISNRDPAKVASMIRLGKSGPADVIAFMETAEQRDGPIQRYEWLSSMDSDGILIEGVLVEYKGKDKPVERLAFLTPDTSGSWKMDFDAFARTVVPSWPDLLVNGAQQALLRVFVGKDVYFNGPFSDDKEWLCYGLASPDTDELLRAYCKVGSAQAQEMERMFDGGEKLCRATLEVRRVPGAAPRQFEITRLLASEWVVADGP